MKYQKIDIAGLKINIFTKGEFLDLLQNKLLENEKIFITTLYSEFLLAGLLDKKILEMLNTATFALADGIGILWAQKFLSIPLTAKSHIGKILQALFQLKYTLASILFWPKFIKQTIPETIVGANLIWDLAKLAEEKNKSVYLLGGFGSTPEKVAEKLKQKFPLLVIAGASNKNPNDASIIEDIQKVKPDFLFVAFGPIKQEEWIAQNLHGLPIQLAIGLGGTFDYIAGTKKQPPQIIRKAGLEWLYRLITQPKRAKRIWNATWRLCSAMLRYKVYNSYPFRRNVVCVIFNTENKILVCQRIPRVAPGFPKSVLLDAQNHWQFPQGGVDNGEDIITSGIRELLEETGIQEAVYIATSKNKHSYLWPNAGRSFFPGPSRFLFKGQEQTIVYFKLENNNQIISMDKVEFSNYQWVKLEDLSKTLHTLRKPLADIVLNDSSTDEALKNGLK